MRRLTYSLLLLTCLLGIVEPVLACAAHNDCYPAGCPEPKREAGGAVQFGDCCATGTAAVGSISITAQPRQVFDRTSGSPAFIAPLPSSRVVLQRKTVAPASKALFSIDQSLTYLHTARLRL